ncbi:MAG: phytanoyl-CoA dioxygenase family protein [bacterium]|nr:phytanoyl-CoA dioxygenase family protein [bacterium]
MPATSQIPRAPFELVPPDAVDKAVRVFHRDGFVAIENGLSATQLERARQGAQRVIDEQTAAIPLDKANRGHARYSFGAQHHHPEWTQLIEIPHLLAILQAIFGSDGFHCSGAGGDYSLPGARMQALHSDMGDCLNDPDGRVTIFDLPTPFIVINFPMVDFRRQNGATRFVPCTHRTRLRPPALQDEPQWMQESIVEVPAGTALVRDVRCWHGGTANDSQQTRAMTSVGYYAPWFHRPGGPLEPMPRQLYDTLGARGQFMCRSLLEV